MIYLIKSTFYKEEKTKRLLKDFISKASRLSFGSECLRFEGKFSKYQGRKHCIFVNSGSSANLALIQALLNTGKLKRGDKVAFSALTWSTNIMPVIQLGLIPVPIDIELDTLNVSSKTLINTIEKNKIKAFFLTNLLGFCDDIDEILAICRKKKIILIEDNCESLGTIYKGKRLGNFGIASTFSFYVGHHMSTIEGGAICTDDDSLAEELRIVRAHGWDRNLSIKGQNKMRNKFKVNSTFYSRYTFYDLGYNLRPTEINGFIGNSQIIYLDEIVEKRNKNFLKLAKSIYGKTKNYYPIRYEHIDYLSNFAFPIICRSVAIRDKLVDVCDNKVEIRPIVGGDMTRQPFFLKYVKNKWENPNARLIHEQGLYFGNNPELTDGEIQFLIKIFTK